MGFKALTVNTAVEAAGHIYAEDDAAIFQSMFGGDGVLNIGNCLKSTVISNNKVRISDGVLSVGGHIGRLSHADYQDMTIENGATGYNRNDIIYARFLTSGNVDSFILAVKKGTATTGTATDPALVQGNLYEGAVERDYPLYRVKLSGLSISSVDQLFTVIPTIPDLKAQMEKDKAEINQSLTNLKNPAKGTKGVQVISGSALSRDFLLCYTLQSTNTAYSGAYISINGITVAQLTNQSANCKQTIVGSVRAFKGDIITITTSNFGGDASVYAYC